MCIWYFWTWPLGDGHLKTREKRRDLSLRNRQMGKWAVDWHHLSGVHLTCERLIQVNSLKFTRNFLSLQKEINFRYISITTVIFTESYTVEKAVSRLLPLSLSKSLGKWFWLKALTTFSLIWSLGVYRLGRCFLAQWEALLNLFLEINQGGLKIWRLWLG